MKLFSKYKSTNIAWIIVTRAYININLQEYKNTV